MMFRNEGIPHEPPGLDDGRPSMSVDARATTTDGVGRGWGVGGEPCKYTICINMNSLMRACMRVRLQIQHL